MLIKYLRKLSLDEIFYNIQDVYSKEKCLAEKWKVNLEYLRNLYQRSKGEKKGLYSLNIEMIESFRYQRSLSQINQQVKKELGACSQHFIEDISFEVSEKLEKIHLKKIYLMNTVAGIGEYLEVISDKIKSLMLAEQIARYGFEECVMWTLKLERVFSVHCLMISIVYIVTWWKMLKNCMKKRLFIQRFGKNVRN